MQKNTKPDSSKLPNYFAILAIAPAILAVLAYEFLDFMIYIIHPERTDYQPINGIGILVPMALLMELFTFILTHFLMKKVIHLTDAIANVAKGNFDVVLDESHAAPLTEVVHDFNQMTAQLKSVQMLRTDFINDFSHEFKTPIASINGFANLLLDTQLSDEDQQEYLRIIAEESSRLTHLAEQTMLMSRLDSQIVIPDCKNYAIDEQIKQNIILLSKEWNEKNISMDVNLAPATYYGNANFMSHIWINLLNNAIKFTPINGTITITLKTIEKNLLITISDSGLGMSEEQTSHIFDRYYQAETSHSGKGLGLGLSIVHRIIELCKGEISVTSTPGVGSSFTVKLPK